MLLIAAACFSSPASAKGLKWEDYEDALKLARKNGKNVMIMFYTDRCKFCKWMDEKTYADESVYNYLNENYVSVRINSDEEEELSDSYFVRGYPTIWFLEPDGRKLLPIPGYVTVEQFLPILEFVTTKAYNEKSLEEYLEEKLN